MRNAIVAVRPLVTSVALAVGLLALLPRAAWSEGPPDGLNVRVLNTPLPVTGNVTSTVNGSVTIANTPLAVTQGTTPWTVGIVGTPSVNVANAPLPVTGAVGLAAGTSVGIDPAANTVRVTNLPAAPATKAPVTFQLSFLSHTTDPHLTYTVPADRWLVVQDVNVGGSTDGEDLLVQVYVQGGGVYYVPVTRIDGYPSNQARFFYGGRTVCWYFGPGSVVELGVQLTLSGTFGGAHATLVGYLTDRVE